MKKICSVLILITIVNCMNACTGSSSSNPNEPVSLNPSKKVEVFYFHFSRRCSTCINVENESRKAVETLYPEQVKKGEITFQSVNLDEKEGEAIGAKYKIEGQTLIIISDDKRVDLTDKGFLYANNSPEKLKAEFKKAIDGFLK
jgi:hypothetical protein